VSAFWAAIWLVALWVGLRRGAQWLRLAGFALFGLALAKLFLCDLAFLSSITRVFSFLAVGAASSSAACPEARRRTRQRNRLKPI
jgi:uncharacterized membrane protein